jgi:hypothetical protein
MDPNQALENIRLNLGDIARYGANNVPTSVDAVVEAFEALDMWLMNGGFLPKDWSNKR